jgi:hypothetical protein
MQVIGGQKTDLLAEADWDVVAEDLMDLGQQLTVGSPDLARPRP